MSSKKNLEFINLEEIVINVVKISAGILFIYLFLRMMYNITKSYSFSDFGSQFNLNKTDFVGFTINIRTDDAYDDCKIKGKYKHNKLTNIEFDGDGPQCTELKNNNKL